MLDAVAGDAKMLGDARHGEAGSLAGLGFSDWAGLDRNHKFVGSLGVGSGQSTEGNQSHSLNSTRLATLNVIALRGGS